MDIKIAQELKSYYLQKSLALNTAEKNKNHYLQTYPEDLSHVAWGAEIAQLPLAEQCLKLDITLEKLEGLPYGKKPEIDALNHFSTHGFVGQCTELKPHPL